MNELPSELLSVIFGDIKSFEKLAASMVCRNFLFIRPESNKNCVFGAAYFKCPVLVEYFTDLGFPYNIVTILNYIGKLDHMLACKLVRQNTHSSDLVAMVCDYAFPEQDQLMIEWLDKLGRLRSPVNYDRTWYFCKNVDIMCIYLKYAALPDEAVIISTQTDDHNLATLAACGYQFTEKSFGGGGGITQAQNSYYIRMAM